MSKILHQPTPESTQPSNSNRRRGKTSRNLYQSMDKGTSSQHRDFLTIIEDDLNTSKNSN